MDLFLLLAAGNGLVQGPSVLGFIDQFDQRADRLLGFIGSGPQQIEEAIPFVQETLQGKHVGEQPIVGGLLEMYQLSVAKPGSYRECGMNATEARLCETDAPSK